MNNYPKADFILRVGPWSLAAVGSAFLAVGISFLLRAAVAEFGGTLYFATYFPSVLVVSVFAGVPAGVLTVALTTVLVWWAYLPPSFEFGPLSRNDLANIVTFWLSAVLIVTLAHTYRKTLRSALKGEEARELLIREQSWSRLSEQNLRVDKWSVCRG